MDGVELQDGIGDPVTLLFDEDLLKSLPDVHHPGDSRSSSPAQVRSCHMAAAVPADAAQSACSSGCLMWHMS